MELVWSCPSADLVCLPEGLCVPCAGEGESPASAAGGHCCGGLVQNAEGTECVLDPNPGECLATGDICGYSGVTQECCEGSVCNPITDLCEPDGSTPGMACIDYEPPGIDNCTAGGEATADLRFEGAFGEVVDAACTVAALSSEDLEESLSLDCDGETYQLIYSSGAPHLVAPVVENDEVQFSMRFYQGEFANARRSIILRSPQGELLMAFVGHYDLMDPLTLPIEEFSMTFGDTGCSAFDAGSPLCDSPGELVAAGHVSVQLQTEEGAVEPLQAGGAAEFSLAGRSYDVIVDEASRIVCWDPSCAGDESGPFDALELLIVAR